jgi:hypothetical protein
METINNKVEYKDKESYSLKVICVAQSSGRRPVIVDKITDLWFQLKKSMNIVINLTTAST